ncbi:MAG: YbaB/EbfC family nucleoid-associated protein [Anaerolineae bacterium]|nr:YbaB/EbfC family nucleoid-associated protein [Anaerolineae bacterium]
MSSYKGRKGGMGLNPNDLMRQVQRMQKEVERTQAEAAEETITVSAGGGVIEVTITGGLEIKSVKIEPDVVDPEDVEMLQDLITAAVNEAIQKAQGMMADKMSAITGGLGIPGL